MFSRITEYRIAKFRNYIWAILRKLIGHQKFQRRKYYGKEIADIGFLNHSFTEAIKNNVPFLVARFGDAELRATVYAYERELGIRNKFPPYIKNVMHMNAGFFPATDESLYEFGKAILQSIKQVDIWGVWFNILEDYFTCKFRSEADLVPLEALEPYRMQGVPWSAALKGKKVLVVHPFANTIQAQYKKRELLFPNTDVLPEFELITYKAIQTNAGGTCIYDTWFEALDAMFEDIKTIDFDVAIVGCGSYGLPLSAKIKKLDKQVMHLAGATQLLFGIRGARWDVRPELQYLFNEHWTRASDDEKPKLAKEVEGGCYW